ncbi:hypothetical protein HOH87_01975 [bacterium]|jgi:hypothetical protein|nr:hypothetical protein [bacterium]
MDEREDSIFNGEKGVISDPEIDKLRRDAWRLTFDRLDASKKNRFLKKRMTNPAGANEVRLGRRPKATYIYGFPIPRVQ